MGARVSTIGSQLLAEQMFRRSFLKAAAVFGGAAVTGTLVAGCRRQAAGPTKLVVLTHWGAQPQKDVLEPIFKRYQEEHPRIQIEHQTVAFGELLNRITTGRLGGVAPDIYHFYNLWLPEFVASDLLQVPPDNVINEIRQGYSESTINGVTYRGQIWGFPTEVNSYLLLSNRQLLQEAGVTEPPATWDELLEVAPRLTKKDASGQVTQTGFAFSRGWDSGVVHPFTSLLWSNGGEYVAEDFSQVRFNEPPGVETLELELELIKSGGADLGFAGPGSSGAQDDFPAGRVGMVIMANWYGASLRAGLPGGIENVIVSPIPHSTKGKSTTLQYNWLWGVDKNSKNAEAAWEFLTWLNTPKDSGSSPMGDYLTTGLNAIPARLSNQEAHADLLGDAIVKPFVESLQRSRTEPIIPGAQEIKTSLQKQIEAAWFGEKSAQEALDTAAVEANRILAEKRQQ